MSGHLSVLFQRQVKKHEGNFVEVVHLHRVGLDCSKPDIIADYFQKITPDQVNPSAVLVKASQGQEHPGFENVLDGSLERKVKIFRSPTWVGSQPENQAGRLDLTEK